MGKKKLLSLHEGLHESGALEKLGVDYYKRSPAFRANLKRIQENKAVVATAIFCRYSDIEKYYQTTKMSERVDNYAIPIVARFLYLGRRYRNENLIHKELKSHEFIINNYPNIHTLMIQMQLSGVAKWRNKEGWYLTHEFIELITGIEDPEAKATSTLLFPNNLGLPT